MRPSRQRYSEHRFVIANEADFQRWLELVLEAERGRLRQVNSEPDAEVAAVFEGASSHDVQEDQPRREQRRYSSR
jgi:hypothetical protein